MSNKQLTEFFVVRVDPKLLAEIDALALKTTQCRSEFVRNAITDYIVHGRWIKKIKKKD